MGILSNRSKPTYPSSSTQYVLHVINALEQVKFVWRNPTQITGAQQADAGNYSTLASRTIAIVNDIYTLLPEFVRQHDPQQLAAIAVCAGCRSLDFHLVPFHSDSFGIWRLFWPDIARETLEDYAKTVLDTIASPPKISSLSSSAEQEAHTNANDHTIHNVEELDRLAGDENKEEQDKRQNEDGETG